MSKNTERAQTFVNELYDTIPELEAIDQITFAIITQKLVIAFDKFETELTGNCKTCFGTGKLREYGEEEGDIIICSPCKGTGKKQ